MRSALTVACFAGTLAMLVACGGGGPEMKQQPVGPNEFGTSGPIPKRNKIESTADTAEPRAPHDQAVRLGDAQVRLTTLQIGEVPLKSFQGAGTSSEPI
ncbi:hypothetical protein [Zavarzinella formosa]|uniref:hypothetical protein n=1 Tax=Zavarzinella formosa TaxID=360055 RepID=UPI0002D9E79B|nr:hypothetical protein [Zavarzinella formosa]